MVRASGLHPEGRWFESNIAHLLLRRPPFSLDFSCYYLYVTFARIGLERSRACATDVNGVGVAVVMLKRDSDLLTCARCGKKNRWNESYCSACGSKIELTERPTIDLPRLSESVGKLELWGRSPSKAKPVRELDEPYPLPKTQPSKNEAPKKEAPKNEAPKIVAPKNETPKNEAPVESRTAKLEAPSESYAQESEEIAEKQIQQSVSRPFNRCWREAWLKFYRASPKRSIYLLALVLAELFMFCPYVLMVLCVFQYDAYCAVLAISSVVVLLTHGICVFASYCSIFEQDKNRYDEIVKAVEKTHSLLKLGATFISIFLLAFFICLSCNNAADSRTNPPDVYKPVSFDD